jgi:Flp pilus assembly pilin Flp
MLKVYMKTRDLADRLLTDKDGVVSLEYVIVGAAVAGVVALVFGGTGTNTLNGVLTQGFTNITTAMGG